MTLSQLQKMLEARGASMTIHLVGNETGDGSEFIAWIHAPDDPGVIFVSAAHESLEKAVTEAIEEWDTDASDEGGGGGEPA